MSETPGPGSLGTLGELAQRTGGHVIGDPSVAIERIAAIDDADATTLTFAVDEKYLRAALGSRAAAVLADASLLAPGTTISASIANEFTEAVGKLYTSSLIALGLLLFVLTFTIIAAARLLLLQIERRGARV